MVLTYQAKEPEKFMKVIFYYFDYIIAMDKDNIEILKSICPTDSQSQIKIIA